MCLHAEIGHNFYLFVQFVVSDICNLTLFLSLIVLSRSFPSLWIQIGDF
jgi:hypothetical protein